MFEKLRGGCTFCTKLGGIFEEGVPMVQKNAQKDSQVGVGDTVFINMIKLSG